MLVIILAEVFLLMKCVQSRCSLSSSSEILMSEESQNCFMEESNNKIAAGAIQNLSTRCGYKEKHQMLRSEKRQMFYYEISWNPPTPTETALLGYRIKISYDFSMHVCFQLPPSQNRFVFNKSMGLVYGCDFTLYVTPLPVVYVDGFFQQDPLKVTGCPVPAKLSPLPNIIVKQGSAFTFNATFYDEPIPPASIKWFFSPDNIYCKNRVKLLEYHYNVKISRDGLVLKIPKVSRKHIGCYVVSADNGVGRVDEQRGYLDLDVTSSMTRRQRNNKVERMFIGSLAGVIIVLFVGFLLVFRYRRLRLSNADSEVKILNKKVYISHCLDKKKEKALLAQFSNALENLGISVITDPFNTVGVQNAGGLSQWVPQNMRKADKIFVFLTPKYIKALEFSILAGTNDDDIPLEHLQKVHAEINAMGIFCGNRLNQSSEQILVASKNVQKSECPNHLLVVQRWYKFPTTFHVKRSATFRAIADALLDSSV